MSAIAIIPARGGSKRLPNKNLKYIGDLTLVVRAIKTAFDAGIFQHVILSTDSAEIAEHARSYCNNLTIFQRPSELAQDDTPMLPVVHHVLKEYVKTFKAQPDDIVLLQPTSPFRSIDDIHSAYRLHRDRQADSVVSVTQPEADLVFRLGHVGRMRPEPNVVVPNGAIYVLSVDALISGDDWYSGIAYAYKMPKERSLDIDTELDLKMARVVMESANA